MLGALAGLLVALASAPAAAPRVDLTWRAPAACPGAEDIQRRLHALAPELPAGPQVRVVADVTPRGSSWRLQLALRGPGLDDRRVIEARDCHGLADVTALLIALAVAPEVVAARVVPAAPPPGGPNAPAPPGPSPAVRTRDFAPTAGAAGRPGSPLAAPPRDSAPNAGTPASPDSPLTALPRDFAPNAGAPGRPGSPLTAPPRDFAPNTSAAVAPDSPLVPPPLDIAPPSGTPAPPLDGQPALPGLVPPADAAIVGADPRLLAPLPAADAPNRASLAVAADPPLLGAPLDDPGTPAPSRLRGAVRVGGGGEVGAIPAWSPTAGLAVSLFGGPWRVELVGTYAARALAYPEREDVGGRLLLAAGGLRGCGVPRWRRLEFPLCGGLELGLVRAVGRGVAEPQPARALWMAAQLSPGLTWAPSRFLALTLHLDVLVALRRPGFHVASLGELARAERIGLRPMVGVEARFP